jgi:3-deoxy-manno-octulosonate cytidylyltransferase (CMP-KDO synthetase)
MNKEKFVGIIPARYASTRFPGKPLASIGGKLMIQRVYEQASKVLDLVYVATDDQRIYDAVVGFGGKAIMTSDKHKSGTDRICEAYEKSGCNREVVVNIQGDEPFIMPSQISTVCDLFDSPETQIATLVKPFSSNDSFADLENPNSPKVVIDGAGNAVYFSRSIIPYLRGVEKSEWLKRHTFFKHIGLYAYKAEVLKHVTKMPQSTNEICESLEQLRWIDNGLKIKVGQTETQTIGIDTPEDMARAEEFLKSIEK